MSLLDIKHVNITYKVGKKRIYAVQDACLEIDPQDAVGIVGESGSGKSTLAMGILRLISDQIADIDGEAVFDGQNLLSLTPDQLNARRWKDIAVVFQKSMNALSPVHRIGRQMEDIYHIHMPHASRQEAQKRILELFRIVNLSDRVYQSFPHELSGGMMQRVSIALSLMFNPRLLVMDEATTALDVVTQGQILREIMDLQASMKLTRIMITHDVSVVASTCNKVAVMYAGQMLETGDVRDVLVHPKHPYTQGLMKSFPSFTGEKSELRGIPGSLPDLSVKPTGCVFAPRCPHATEQCRTCAPQMKTVGNKWNVACHMAGGEA